jgi:hypothetical protein
MITFGLFSLIFGNNNIVTITGNDDLSGVASIQYIVRVEGEHFADEATAIAYTGWQSYTTAITLELGNRIVYAKITDNAGNVTIINSDGITVADILETVETPTATPNGGTFTGSRSVTLSTATDGATIYYTIDGTAPTTSATQYTEAFTLTATTTVRAIAVKDGMENSAVMSVTFTRSTGGDIIVAPIITTPPVTTTPQPVTTTPPPATTTSPTVTTPPTTTTPPVTTTLPTATTPPTTTTPVTTTTAPPINNTVIEEILKQAHPVIDLTELDGSMISANDLQAIANSGKDVEVVLDGGFSFTIMSDSISENARAFDLNIDVTLTSRAEVIDNVRIPANSIVVTPNISGEFGFEIVFTLTAEQLSDKGVNGNNLSLYHINYNRNITNMGKLRLNSDGSIEFTISHASFYVIAENAPQNSGNCEGCDGCEDCRPTTTPPVTTTAPPTTTTPAITTVAPPTTTASPITTDAVPQTTASRVPVYGEPFGPGDVDGDGKITIGDALEILKFLAKLPNEIKPKT